MKRLIMCVLLSLTTISFAQIDVITTPKNTVSFLSNQAIQQTYLSRSAANEAAIVGEYVYKTFASPSPYRGAARGSNTLIYSQVIHYPTATYIAPRFSMMDLAPGDYVVLRSPDGKRKWTYRNQGTNGLGVAEGFWGIPIHGDTAIVELYGNSESGGKGFAIDQFARGYTRAEMGFGTESVCTADDTQEAKCFMNSEPEVYDTARAVVRILKNGNAHCTGWIVGDEGHILTNEHCVADQSEADNLTLELMAEGPDCATNCDSALGCPGIIEATGPMLIQNSEPYDYALLLPNSTVNPLPATYGFMQLRATGAVLNEQIYIPQHPAGWGKRVAFSSSYPDDVTGNGGLGQVNSVNESGCGGPGPDIGYWLDTQGGSSGSPVVAYNDHKIVALHHCRGSGYCDTGGSGDDPNRGVPIQAVIADLGANVPNGAVCDSPDVPTNVSAVANGSNQIDVSWSAPAGGPYLYDVYRALGGCNVSAYKKIATGVNNTVYVDSDVSGGSEYSYKIKTYDSVEACTSIHSMCDSATATGICTLTPTFSGVEQVTNLKSGMCSVQVDWSQSTNNCGTGVVYNIYRSLTENFTPAPGNLISSCETGTSFTDSGLDSGQTYYYNVQSEDDSGNGSGACAAGNENSGLLSLGMAATGPDNNFFTDNLDSGTSHWSTAPGPGNGSSSPWQVNTSTVYSAPNAWFVADENDTKDQLLLLDETINVTDAGLELKFQQYYNTESGWDGGALEYSTDGGSTWYDILAGNGGTIPANTERFILNGYSSSLRGGPLNGRAAWSGNSGGWQEVVVTLSDFVGENVQFRWRMSCDGSVGDEGWYIDNISFIAPTQCGFIDLIYMNGFE